MLSLGKDLKGRRFYSTVAMRKLEARNLETVKDLAGTFRSVTSEQEVTGYLDSLTASDGVQLTRGKNPMS